jgi:hypothetical protein
MGRWPMLVSDGPLALSAHTHTQDRLVEPPALGSFTEPGWTTVSVLEEIPATPAQKPLRK